MKNKTTASTLGRANSPAVRIIPPARRANTADPDETLLVRAQAAEAQAMRETAAERAEDPPEAGLDPTLPTSPVSGEAGHEIAPSPRVDEEDDDEEGRSVTERLVEAGEEEAEREQTREAGGNDRPSRRDA